MQGHASFELCNFCNLSPLFLDRGYLNPEVIMVLRQMQLHIVRTQKRGKQNPFSFGDGRRFEGVRYVTEIGIMADFGQARHGWTDQGYITSRFASAVRQRDRLCRCSRRGQIL